MSEHSLAELRRAGTIHTETPDGRRHPKGALPMRLHLSTVELLDVSTHIIADTPSGFAIYHLVSVGRGEVPELLFDLVDFEETP